MDAAEISNGIRSSFARKGLLYIIYLILAGMVMFLTVTNPSINRNARTKLGDMVYGTAHRPFVYRTLTPSIIRGAAAITPDVLKDWIKSKAKGRADLIRLILYAEIEEDFVVEYVYALAIIVACYFGFVVIMGKLIRVFYNFPDYIADFLAPFALLLIPLFFKYCNYLYDPPILILFPLGILLLAKGKRLLFYAVFVLAVINKETAILLAGIFLAKEYGMMKRWTLIGHVLLQTAVWIIIKGVIALIFKDNPGSIAEFHLIDHNIQLIYHIPSLIYVIGIFVLFYLLIKTDWHEKPLFLKRGLLITFIPMSVLSLLWGYLDELRIFYEVYPFAFLLSFPTVARIFNMPEVVR